MSRSAIRTAIVVLAFATAASAQAPAGGEFRVNTYTSSAQLGARVAMEPDGDFVVVWQSDTQDGNFQGAFGQRFAASGTPRGSEFRLNTYTTGRQRGPAVATGSTGDFVVAWESYQYFVGSSIQGRRYDASGSAIGGEFQVGAFTTGNQLGATIGRASDGRFVVGWTSYLADGSSFGMAARRFDASGNSIGSEFALNTYTTGLQGFGGLAVEANGSFVAVWFDNSGDRDGSGSAIFGQRFDPSGNRLGSEFQVNSYTTGFQGSPSVSVSPAGGFVVAWATDGDGSAFAVFSRRFDASGNALGDDFLVNTYTNLNQSGVLGQVSHDARGNFVVTWRSPQDGSLYGSFAQRFSASGARRGAEFRVNTYTTDSQMRPSVSSDSVGNFVVAWDSDGQDGSTYGIFARRFGGLGPAALGVDSPGNQVLEPGETVTVSPSWRNFNGAAQTFSGTLTNITGPAGRHLRHRRRHRRLRPGA